MLLNDEMSNAMRIETNLPEFTLETIEAVEKELGSRFPNELREAWRHDSKFEVGEWFFYPIKDERFFNKTWDDTIRANRDERGLPEHFITVATNGSGDELGFLTSDVETIYVWWHETDELERVADSIEVFVEVTRLESDVIETFCERVNESETVFGLSAEANDGWAYAPSVIEETDVLLFFSTRERALSCRVEEWDNYHVIELPLDLFIAAWLPNMSEDGLLCGLDWPSDLKGMEYDPETVLEAIEEAE
ncbi:DUF2750 domain-containing protein [Exiguobacterium sp. SH1S21]|nr:DUF2750 domain-containing protein [Exiguobacterium sp. SH1S21]TCI69776.1 DUF2750 domain-containing protein [Exiguobacterium sp. SH0S7]